VVPQKKQRIPVENKQGKPKKQKQTRKARMHAAIPTPAPGPKDERVRKHRGRTKPKVIYITINDGSDGVEADKARPGVGVVGTRADWPLTGSA
jgi:hypothetical protein